MVCCAQLPIFLKSSAGGHLPYVEQIEQSRGLVLGATMVGVYENRNSTRGLKNFFSFEPLLGIMAYFRISWTTYNKYQMHTGRSVLLALKSGPANCQ